MSGNHKQIMQQDFVSVENEMAERIRHFDWTKTPLGHMDTWSQSLKTMVSILLSNRFPMLLWWGPEYICIYNNAYVPVLGTKHPWALGKPVRECWSEIWHFLQPLIDEPFHGGEATWMEDMQVEINRHGFLEETHFTVAYSPVPDESAPSGIGGVLATVHEISEKVIGERRINILRDLGAHSTDAKTKEQVCELSAKTIADYPEDIPFVMFYLISEDSKYAHLSASSGIKRGEAISPLIIDLENPKTHKLPFSKVLSTGKMEMLLHLDQYFDYVPQGPWNDALQTAIVIPVPSNIANGYYGIIVAGMSSKLPNNDSYLSFFKILTTQVASALAHANAFEEERKRKEALEEIDKAKTVFFNNISHEFRTPLTLMLGPVEELLQAEKYDDASPEHQLLELIHRNANRLLKLVNTLLDFSRIEAGRIEAFYEPVNLSVLTEDLASSFRSAIEKAHLKFIVDCSSDIRDAYVDPDMWEKIVLNLISNAYKFTKAGFISVYLTKQNNKVQLIVKDSGIGIEPGELPKIFDRFYRIQSSFARTHEGTGIGLSMVKELVHLHGGDIEVLSEINRGTCITVSIPLGKSHLPPEKIFTPGQRHKENLKSVFTQEVLHWSEAPSVNEANHLSQRDLKHILFVDDNADMREYVKRILIEDYDIELASNGKEALDSISRKSPDLLITDIMMPVMDGFGLLKSIRSNAMTAGIPVIMLSARAGEEAVIEGIEKGSDDYLVKPFSSKELITRVSKLLKISEARQQIEKSEKRFRNVLLQSPSIFVILEGPEMVINFVNEPLLKSWGRSWNIIGKPLLEVLPEIQDQPFPKLLETVYRTGETHYGKEEKAVIIKDGKLQDVYYNYVYQPIFEGNGKISGIIIMANDITEQVIARKKVEESGEKYKILFETMDQGFCIIEVIFDRENKPVDCVFLEVNQMFEKLTGLKNAIGKTALELVPGLEKRWMEIYGKVVLTGESIQFTESSNEIGRWFEVYAYRVGPADNRKVAILFTDISERKKWERELEHKVNERTEEIKRSNAKLEKMNEDLASFAYISSHDLQEPLRKIQMFSKRIIEKELNTLSDEGKNFFLRMDNAANRMQQLINDLLKYSRTNTAEKHFELTDMNHLLEEVKQELSEKIAISNTTIECDRLPKLKIIPFQFRQLFMNIINNSIKFAKSGIPPEIKIKYSRITPDNSSPLERQNGHLLSISDNGIGFDPQFNEQIFGVFQRLHSKSEFEGTGIGLSIVKRIVENHHGIITADGQENKGATFTIYLPE